MLTMLTIYMRARGGLKRVPPGVWVAVGVLMVGYGLWAAGDSYGYQRALDERADAAAEAKERADEISTDVDGLDDDGLIDGLLKGN